MTEPREITGTILLQSFLIVRVTEGGRQWILCENRLWAHMPQFINDRESRPIIVLLTLSKEESRSAIGQHFTRMSEVKDLKSIDFSVCFLGRGSRCRLLLTMNRLKLSPVYIWGRVLLHTI